MTSPATLACLDGHLYAFAGLVWVEGSARMGSSARDVVYEDKFFCQRCLDVQYRNARTFGNTYNERILGSVPK